LFILSLLQYKTATRSPDDRSGGRLIDDNAWHVLQ